LLLAGAFDADHNERGSIEDGGKRRNPGLVVMLRAKEGQDRIREMALHQFGGPMLPIFKEFAQRFLSVGIAVAPKKFSGRRRCARARIEQGNIDLAL
jgi:hypothetical protein